MIKSLSTLSLALGLALVSPAVLAADLGGYDPSGPVSFTSAAYDWTGFYAGVNAGYSWGDAALSIGGAPIPGVDLNPAGLNAGVQAGFNMDMGGVLVGAEGDIQVSGVGDSYNAGGREDNSRIDYFGTLRGRVGMPLENVLPYLTGGLAFASNTETAATGGPTLTDTNFHTGWTIGGGIEVAVTDAVSVKAEYLYMDLGAQTYDLGTPVENHLTAHTVRAGINYAF